jgi:cell division protein FtsW (lipid II flippase)
MTDINVDVGRQAHMHTREAAFWAPFTQSLGTGFFLALVVAVIVFLARYRYAWQAILISFVIVSAVVWIVLQYRNLALTLAENITGRDIDGDGNIGSAAPEKVIPVRVDIAHYDEYGNLISVERARFKNEKKMIAIADAIVNRGVSFSVGAMVEREKILTRSEFDVIRVEMEKRGMIVIRDKDHPNLGWAITRAGMAVFRDFLKSTSPPPR